MTGSCVDCERKDVEIARLEDELACMENNLENEISNAEWLQEKIDEQDAEISRLYRQLGEQERRAEDEMYRLRREIRELQNDLEDCERRAGSRF